MYINIPARPLEKWANRLTEAELEVLQDEWYWELDDEITPGEILDALVTWYGGLASACHVKSIINRIYGVEL